MAGTTSTVLLLLALAVVPAAFAANYDISWSNGGDYSSWASDKAIKVGDTVTFQYGGLHSVDEVNKVDYDACSTSNTLSSDSTGNTVVTLSQPGTRYFICGTSGHCGGGMKVAIPAVSATAGSTPSTPSGAATPSAPSAGGGSAPSTPKSSTPSAGAAAAGFQPAAGKAVMAVAGAFLAGGLALLG